MLLAASLAFAFSVQSGSGLSLSFGGVPFIKRSYLQYYEPGWTKGYYSTQWTRQTVAKEPSGKTVMAFKSSDGRAHGTVTYAPEGDRLKIVYELHWEGEKPALVELCGGMVWAPAVQAGTLTVDGQPQRSLMRRDYRSDREMAERQYGGPFSSLVFASPLGDAAFRSSRSDWVLFDARGFRQDYAENDDLFWMGILGVEVAKGKPAKFEAEWSFALRPGAPKAGKTELEGKAERLAEAKAPGERLPLVPQPKTVRLDGAGVFVLGNPSLRLPKGCAEEARLFRVFLGSLWELGRGGGRIEGRIADLGLPEEGYAIKVTPKSATVTGQTKAGLLNGLYTLALMAYPDGGRLVLPTGEARDWPTIGWRGLHTFVGPKTVPFHKEFFERVLRPMKFNRAVLQCERSAWKSAPGIETSMTMPLEELVKEFAMVRSLGIEPIPLIQSFGHMEWLFANGKNLELALNREAPYAIDPRNPRAQQKIKDIWTEAIGLLKPQTVHFGMDEVAMVGMKDDPALVTELWQRQISFLADIARENRVRMMIWGDVALAKGEAIDACNGDSPEEAKKRREAIPAGTLIADWHYADNPDPAPFTRSLRLWKSEGKVPIASTWYRPGNIRGFVLAAAQEGCGALQTTWAGYESNPQALLAGYPQHAAYLVFADYAWSGRQEMPDRLGYDPGALLRRLFLSEPALTSGAAGFSVLPQGSANREARVGPYRFRLFGPLALRSIALPEQNGAPTEAVLRFKAKGRRVVLALDCASRCSQLEKVGTVAVVLASGRRVVRELQYGADVRSPEDRGALIRADREGALGAVEVKVGDKPEEIAGVEIAAGNAHAGLRLHGVTVY